MFFKNVTKLNTSIGVNPNKIDYCVNVFFEKCNCTAEKCIAKELSMELFDIDSGDR